ncbi:MAG: long-chain fatty acid--CoA ligase [Bacteroidetes bacterium]|nr:long-chain fatty acid--CoA ligase [Bacteroidota bacterium]
MALQVQCSTIPEMFQKVSQKYLNEIRPVLMYKQTGIYKSISYKELYNSVRSFANGLISMGISNSDKVGIISENRPEWFVSDMATVSIGAIDVPIYPTLTPKQIEFILNDAGISVVIVSNQTQLNKILKIIADVKNLKTIIVMNETFESTFSNTIQFNKIIELGNEFEKTNSDKLDNLISHVKPEDLITIIYTSGTTGNPKGVMLTHNNLMANITATAKEISIDDTDRTVSFLPLCHIFERMGGYYTVFGCGSTIAYAESVETVRDNLLEVNPTIMTAVPRFFEKVQSRLLKQVDSGSPLKKKIFYWAMEVGKEFLSASKTGKVSGGLSFKHKIANALVYKKLKHRMGGKLKFFISGGAALPKPLGEFFASIGITIIEGYGLTETSPVLTLNRLNDYNFGTVGKPLPDVQIKIADDGEILAKGPNLMKGYYNNIAATNEVIDSDGWFHTGDIGMFDENKNLVITDRKKHLFVSSGGKNIAPQIVENKIIQSKYIDQILLIGDKKMFCSALIVPEFENLKDFAKNENINFLTHQELIKDEKIVSLFSNEIDRFQKDLANFERVRRFRLLADPFTIENNELTPTQKVKRKVVEEKYSQLIEEMYKVG